MPKEYPVNYALTHGFWVMGTCFPDPKIVPNAPDYRAVYPNAPGDIVYDGHRGLDTAASVRPDMPALGNAMPLYAIEDGVVIEATDDNGSTSGTFVWAKTGGISITVRVDSIKKREVCYSMQHMSKRVKGVGDRVARGQLVGYQGNTGVSYGAHCHTTFFLDRKYIDPTPYVFGDPDKLLRLKSVYADPVTPAPAPTPAPDKETTVNVIARFQYTDTGKLNIRSKPDATSSILGTMDKGTEFNVTELVYTAQYLWGKLDSGGYAVIKAGDAQWCAPVGVKDYKAEYDQSQALLKTATAQVKAANATIAAKLAVIEAAKAELNKG